MGVFSSNFNDLVAIVLEIVWDIKSAVMNIPLNILVFVFLAGGLNLFARNYPESINSTDYPEGEDPLLDAEDVDLNTETLSNALQKKSNLKNIEFDLGN